MPCTSQVTVSENVGTDTVIATFVATDSDAGDVISYTLSPLDNFGNIHLPTMRSNNPIGEFRGGKFMLDANNGELSLSRKHTC